ncbi:MAG: hypothetical protein ACFFC7_34755 [Candidatus Hermodarchaeota archaeon]
MKPYCVTFVSYILPAVRILVAEVLVEKYGLRQKTVAEKMDLTPAAINHYLRRLRSNQTIIEKIRSDDTVFTKIRQIIQHLAEEEMDISSTKIITMVCEVCCLTRENEGFREIINR